MDEQDWIKRLLSSELADEASIQPAPPTAQASVPPRTASVTETASVGRSPEQVALTPQILPPAATPSPTGDTEANVPAIWQVGDVILDQYEVIGKLGEGGMGTIYKVHHRGWNTDLAVKSPRPEIFARANGKENFVREAETWVNLDLHPHIVSCYYVRTLSGIPRVFAEYADGGSLADWIRTRKLYEGGHNKALERMLDVMIQFAWGLHYAHEQGLVHQDVKPANVMLTLDGTAKVTDFGLAKARVIAGETGVLEEGQSILVSSRGMTPAYCSPEQAARQTLSRKTDIWSWGISVLEMFVGGVTWMAGIVAREVLASHERQYSEIPPMPAEVVKLLAHCFQQQPADRPASMSEVAVMLQEVYAHELKFPYPRSVPRPAEALADTLNNRALSLLDLGKVEEAKQVWEQALQAGSQHAEATYNRGVILWRQGKLNDDILVRQLEEIWATQSERRNAASLLAQVHLERGDADAALPLLEEAAQQSPEKTELQVLLRHARSGDIPIRRCLRTFQAHIAKVTSVSLSADGKVALSGSLADENARLWEVATGRPLRTFQTDSLTSMGLAAIEVATGRSLPPFRGFTDSAMPVSLSADGRLALSGSLTDEKVRLWETATGRCLRTFQGHTGTVESVSLSADGSVALSGGRDGTVRLWETATGRCLRTFVGHTYRVESVSLSADGRLALSGSWDRTVRLWETATGRCLRTFVVDTDTVESVCLSADGRLALSGDRDGTIRLWETSQEHFLCSLCLSEASSYADVSQVETQATALLQQAMKARGEARFVAALDLLREARALPGWERSPKVLEEWTRLSHHCRQVDLRAVWSAKTLMGHTERVTSVCLSADGCFALSGSLERTVRFWELATGNCLRILEHEEFVTTVSLSADGRVALSGSWDGTVRLWEVATGRCLRTFQGHTERVTSVCLSTDGSLVLSGSADKTMRSWEVATGRCLRTFQGHTAEVNAVSLSADRSIALSGSADHTVRLWEVATGRCLRTFQGHTAEVNAVSLSADGLFALSGSLDQTVRFWELATGNCLRTLQGHTGAVTSVSLSANRRWAISGSWDQTVRLWNVARGRCLHTLEGHTNQVTSVSLSADRRWAISGSYDQTVRLWELDWELEAHDPADWDEGARPYLKSFLTMHSTGKNWLGRWKRPQWDEQDFQQLLTELNYNGYSWLRPEGIRTELEGMALSWQGPLQLSE